MKLKAAAVITAVSVLISLAFFPLYAVAYAESEAEQPAPPMLLSPSAPSPMDAGELSAGLSWTVYNNGCLEISGSGAVPDFSSAKDRPWHAYSDMLTSVSMTGVTGIGSFAFFHLTKLETVSLSPETEYIGSYAFSYDSSVTGFSLPDAIKTIGGYAFYDCTGAVFSDMPSSLESVAEYAFVNCCALPYNIHFPASLKAIGPYAFSFDNTSPHSIEFSGDAPSFGTNCFLKLTGAAYSSCLKKGWDSSTMQQYGGQLSWEKHANLGAGNIIKSPSCTEPGLVEYTCMDCLDKLVMAAQATGHSAEHTDAVKPGCTTDGNIEYWSCTSCKKTFSDKDCTVQLKPESVLLPMKGHVEVTDEGYPAGPTTEGLSKGSHCSECGTVLKEQKKIPPAGYELTFSGLNPDWSLFIDDECYTPDTNGKTGIYVMPGQVAYAYSFHNAFDNLSELNYPNNFNVFFISEGEEGYSTEKIPALSGLLEYDGVSIRSSGENGIRLVLKADKRYLEEAAAGIAGKQLAEFGVIALPFDKLPQEGLTLQSTEAKRCILHTAYSDAAIKYENQTAVYYADFTGLTNAECTVPLVMRAYMIIRDEQGNAYTVLLGPIARSISYVAMQNSLTYEYDSPRFNFIHKLIKLRPKDGIQA